MYTITTLIKNVFKYQIVNFKNIKNAITLDQPNNYLVLVNNKINLPYVIYSK